MPLDLKDAARLGALQRVTQRQRFKTVTGLTTATEAGTKFPLLCDPMKLNELGPGVPLYFLFLRYVSLVLIGCCFLYIFVVVGYMYQSETQGRDGVGSYSPERLTSLHDMRRWSMGSVRGGCGNASYKLWPETTSIGDTKQDFKDNGTSWPSWPLMGNRSASRDMQKFTSAARGPWHSTGSFSFYPADMPKAQQEDHVCPNLIFNSSLLDSIFKPGTGALVGGICRMPGAATMCHGGICRTVQDVSCHNDMPWWESDSSDGDKSFATDRSSIPNRSHTSNASVSPHSANRSNTSNTTDRSVRHVLFATEDGFWAMASLLGGQSLTQLESMIRIHNVPLLAKSKTQHAGLLPSYAKWDGAAVHWDERDGSRDIEMGRRSREAALSLYEHNRAEYCNDRHFEQLGIAAVTCSSVAEPCAGCESSGWPMVGGHDVPEDVNTLIISCLCMILFCATLPILRRMSSNKAQLAAGRTLSVDRYTVFLSGLPSSLDDLDETRIADFLETTLDELHTNSLPSNELATNELIETNDVATNDLACGEDAFNKVMASQGSENWAQEMVRVASLASAEAECEQVTVASQGSFKPDCAEVPKERSDHHVVRITFVFRLRRLFSLLSREQRAADMTERMTTIIADLEGDLLEATLKLDARQWYNHCCLALRKFFVQRSLDGAKKTKESWKANRMKCLNKAFQEQKNLRVTGAFVTFEHEVAARRAMTVFAPATRIWQRRRDVPKFDKIHLIGASGAPEPSDILWENIGESKVVIVLCRVFGILVCLSLMAVVSFLIYSLKRAKGSKSVPDEVKGIAMLVEDNILKYLWKYLPDNALNYSVGPAVIFADIALRELVHLSVGLELRRSRTHAAASAMWKHTAASIFNSALVCLFVHAEMDDMSGSCEKNWYLGGNLVEDALAICSSSMIITPFILFLSPWGNSPIMSRLKILAVNPRSSRITQEQLNELYGGVEYRMGYRYASAFKTIFLTLLYAPLVPVVLPMGTVSICLQYWADKVCLIRTARRPPFAGTKNAFKAMHILPFILLPIPLLTIFLMRGTTLWPLKNLGRWIEPCIFPGDKWTRDIFALQIYLLTPVLVVAILASINLSWLAILELCRAVLRFCRFIGRTLWMLMRWMLWASTCGKCWIPPPEKEKIFVDYKAELADSVSYYNAQNFFVEKYHTCNPVYRALPESLNPDILCEPTDDADDDPDGPPHGTRPSHWGTRTANLDRTNGKAVGIQEALRLLLVEDGGDDEDAHGLDESLDAEALGEQSERLDVSQVNSEKAQQRWRKVKMGVNLSGKLGLLAKDAQQNREESFSQDDAVGRITGEDSLRSERKGSAVPKFGLFSALRKHQVEEDALLKGGDQKSKARKRGLTDWDEGGDEDGDDVSDNKAQSLMSGVFKLPSFGLRKPGSEQRIGAGDIADARASVASRIQGIERPSVGPSSLRPSLIQGERSSVVPKNRLIPPGVRFEDQRNSLNSSRHSAVGQPSEIELEVADRDVEQALPFYSAMSSNAPSTVDQPVVVGPDLTGPDTSDSEM